MCNKNVFIYFNLSLKTFSCVLMFVCRTGNNGNIIYSQFFINVILLPYLKKIIG